MTSPRRLVHRPGVMAASALGAATLMTPALLAQSLEPRSQVNTPVGMNFAIVGDSYTEGDVIPGPSLPLKDAEITMQGLFLAFASALNLWGDSGKVDGVLPYNWASGTATFAGQPHSRIWTGMDGTFDGGGTSSMDGIANDDRQSNSRFGLTLALPLGLHQSIKLFGSMGASARAGGDFTTVGIAWQYRWGGGLPSSPPGK